MAGYVLLNVDVTDRDVFEGLVERAPASVEAHGGEYLIRGGAVEALQGNWTPHRVVLVKFGSIEQARAWWSSSDHVELRAAFGQVRQHDRHARRGRVARSGCQSRKER